MRLSLQIDKPFRNYVKRPWLRQAVSKTLKTAHADPNVQLDLVITDDDTTHELNRTYRHVDAPTDVLAFALAESSIGDDVFVEPPDQLPALGEVIVSYPTAVRQAEQHGHPVEKELAVLVIHGVLHLLGYDHHTDEEEREMRALEAEALKKVERAGNTRPAG